ncbi:MAG: molybdenum cofactor guanylyltransferase [Polyangiaceae bacterium]
MPEMRDRAAIVLSGGQSSRMGQPKEWLDFRGRPLLAHVVDLLLSRASTVVVVARAEQALPSLRPEVTRLDDPVFEQGPQGPLPALTKGLVWLADRGCSTAYLSSCDAAGLSASHLDQLASLLDEVGPSYEAVLPVSNDGQEHPLAALVRVEPAARAAKLVELRQERRLRSLFVELRTKRISERDLRDPEVLRAFNTEAEWRALLGSR